MRRQLIAAGATVILMVGAASPAIAHANNGKPKGPKPNHKSGVSGGGNFASGTFSVQARAKHQPKGHFNYTAKDGSWALRCRGFVPFAVAPSKAGTTVEFTKCVTLTGTEPNQVRQAAANVSVTFVDNGQPSRTVKDNVTFTFSGTPYGGALTGGNVKIS